MRIQKSLMNWSGAAVLIGFMVCNPASAESLLGENGQPRAEIIISETPPRAVKLAATELQSCIEKISGAKLPIVTASGTDVKTHVYVGISDYTDRLKITDEGLKYGAFRMVSGDDWLVLLGHDKDFTMPQYAVRSRADWPRP